MRGKAKKISIQQKLKKAKILALLILIIGTITVIFAANSIVATTLRILDGQSIEPYMTTNPVVYWFVCQGAITKMVILLLALSCYIGVAWMWYWGVVRAIIKMFLLCCFVPILYWLDTIFNWIEETFRGIQAKARIR